MAKASKPLTLGEGLFYGLNIPLLAYLDPFSDYKA